MTPILTSENAIYAAKKFIDYYDKFDRIDDYYRYVKQSRYLNGRGRLFGPDQDIFSDFSMHPQDMDIQIHTVGSEERTRFNQVMYSELLNHTSSAPIEEAIPGRTIKWIVTEGNTGKVLGVVRFGSPTPNNKARNIYFGQQLPLSQLNNEFVMGFIIIPMQPFGFNYLGGKLLCLLASSKYLKDQFDKKYNTDLKYFETTSLYGTTKGMSMYDGLKPYVRYIGDTESNFLPMFHDDYFNSLFWWFNENANNGERLVDVDKSGKKLKIQHKMISIIKRSLKDKDVLDEFLSSLEKGRSLTQCKRTYLGTFNHSITDAIDWWKKKATKRYDKLNSEGRIRTELELWNYTDNIDIIR